MTKRISSSSHWKFSPWYSWQIADFGVKLYIYIATNHYHSLFILFWTGFFPFNYW